MFSRLVAIVVLVVSGGVAAADEKLKPAPAALVDRFLLDARDRARAAEQAKRSFVAGRDGWLFFAPELRSLSVGPFWGKHAAAVSRAANKKYVDPLEPIVDFHRQLKAAGITLRVVPVPAKACVYPDGLSADVSVSKEHPLGRLDRDYRRFYRLLRERGVPVVDLLPRFVRGRSRANGPLFCRTDTHWSGQGVAVAAAAILQTLDDPDWLKPIPRTNYLVRTRRVTITGDLARMVNAEDPATETMTLTFIGHFGTDKPIATSRTSPVLLMGDSHTLVFHDPALHAAGAGLPDHLAAGLGFPVDLIGVRGSGASATRITLLRRRDNLAGKKLVIWCFSVRELTESFSGWRKVPVIRGRGQ